MHIENKKENVDAIVSYLTAHADIFVPPLTGRVDIPQFASKIACNAEQFWVYAGDVKAGFMACYFNHPDKEFGFVASFSIIPKFQNMGMGKALIREAISFGVRNHFRKLRLEVQQGNDRAEAFYSQLGFMRIESSSGHGYFELDLGHPAENDVKPIVRG